MLVAQKISPPVGEDGDTVECTVKLFSPLKENK